MNLVLLGARRYAWVLGPVSAALACAAMAMGCSGSSAGVGLFGCTDAGCPVPDPSSSSTTSGGSGLVDASGPSFDAQASGDDGGPGLDGAASGVDASPGGPCERDVECDTGLCNLSLDRCSVPAPQGAACERDVECAGSLCNLHSDTCQPKHGAGLDCERDTECASGICNLALDTCK